MKFFTITTTLFLLVFSAQAQVLSVKEQAVTINEVLTDRIDNLLPKLMDEAKIDCWLIISREYNEDPIIKTFLQYKRPLVQIQSAHFQYEGELLLAAFCNGNIFMWA